MEDNLSQYYDNEGGTISFNTTAYSQASYDTSSDVTTADLKSDSFSKIAYDYDFYENDYDSNREEAMRIRKSHNKKCIISLVLMFGVPILVQVLAFLFSSVFGVGGGLISALLSSNANTSSSSLSAFESLSNIGSIFSGSISNLCRIGAVVLMIVARVQDKDATFGKVLMWIYIARIILGIVVGVLAIIIAVAILGVVFSTLF